LRRGDGVNDLELNILQTDIHNYGTYNEEMLLDDLKVYQPLCWNLHSFLCLLTSSIFNWIVENSNEVQGVIVLFHMSILTFLIRSTRPCQRSMSECYHLPQ
jgi:hypothetical protein